MHYLPIRIFTAVFTLVFGIFSVASINKVFHPASPGKQISESVSEEMQALQVFPHYSVSFLEGQNQALGDIKMGRLRIASTAEKTAREKIFRDILFKEYGIDTFDFGWTTNQKLIKQNDEMADGYNQIAKIVIEQRFGWDVLENVKARAIAAAFREQEEINKKILQRQLDFPHSIE